MSINGDCLSLFSFYNNFVFVLPSHSLYSYLTLPLPKFRTLSVVADRGEGGGGGKDGLPANDTIQLIKFDLLLSPFPK